MIDKINDLLMQANEIHPVFSSIEKPSSNGLAEKMNELMPSIYIFIATLGALLVILLVLTKFLYNPIQKMVQRRKEFIKKNIDESIAVKKEAFQLENEARLKLQDSKKVSEEIIAQARIEAEKIKNKYIEQGRFEAQRIIEETNKELEAKKRDLEKETYNEIVSVAMEVSEQIIKDKINDKEVKKYLDNYLGN